MKNTLKSVGHWLIRFFGCYILAVVVMGFFPQQINQTSAFFSAMFGRIAGWAPFMGTFIGWLMTGWNWLTSALPFLGITLILLLVRWFIRRR